MFYTLSQWLFTSLNYLYIHIYIYFYLSYLKEIYIFINNFNKKKLCKPFYSEWNLLWSWSVVLYTIRFIVFFSLREGRGANGGKHERGRIFNERVTNLEEFSCKTSMVSVANFFQKYFHRRFLVVLNMSLYIKIFNLKGIRNRCSGWFRKRVVFICITNSAQVPAKDWKTCCYLKTVYMPLIAFCIIITDRFKIQPSKYEPVQGDW